MADISQLIEPESDQLNADDLIAGPRTIRIRDVKVAQSGEQRLSIFFDGDNGKPWKPCKTMARALVNLWKTADSQNFIGRSVTLSHDPNVTWAGAKVGGIRIMAVSHIAEPTLLAVSESKTKRVLKMIQPLKVEQQQEQPSLTLDQARADMKAATSLAALKDVWQRKAMAPHREALGELLDTQKAALAEPDPGTDENGGEGRDDSQMGEAHTQAAYAAAIEEIDRCPTVDAVDSALLRLRPDMETDEQGDDLAVHAGKRRQALGGF